MDFESELAGGMKPERGGRPGCVTLYTLWLWLISVVILGFGGLMGLLIFAEVAEVPEPDMSTIMPVSIVILGSCGGIALVPFVTGIGIWRMSMWGWLGVMFLHTLGILFFVFRLLGNIMGMMEGDRIEGVMTVVLTLCFLGIGVGIMGWFWSERRLFVVRGMKWNTDSEDTNVAGDRVITMLFIVGLALVFSFMFMIVLLTLLRL